MTVAGSNLAGVTQAENWLTKTKSPFFFIPLNLFTISHTRKDRIQASDTNLSFDCLEQIQTEILNFEFSFIDLNPKKTMSY